MNALLNKFDEIIIENKSRLSEKDRKYCEKQQSLYENVLLHYNQMFIKLMELDKEDKAFYNCLDSNDGESKQYFYNFVSLTKEKFVQIIKETHNQFISKIISYFRKTYNVNLENKGYVQYFNVEEPSQPRDYYGFRDLSDDEIEQLKESKRKYQEHYDLYLDKIISFVLKFDSIVDDIFEFLGGFSFDEKVEQEIKEDSLKAAVNQYRDTRKFEIKNGKISFTGCTHSYKDTIWNRYEISLGCDDYLAILRALTFFDSNKGETDIYYNWKDRFTSYHYGKKKEEDGIYDTHKTYCSTVISFKYYKNGKWEVGFDTHTNALKFAKEYLGYSE